MKAIQIKVLPATITKPMRMKVMVEGVKPLYYSCGACYFDYSSVDSIELQAAKKFLIDSGLNWHEKYNLVIGRLPNKDYCVVLTNKG